MFKKRDLWIILPCLLAAAVLFLWFGLQPSSGIAVVEKSGTEIYRFDLDKQQTKQIVNVGGDYHVQLLLEPGAISFFHSDCRDQVCVRTGKLTKPGQVAVCLPAKVSVRVISKRKKSYDGYTG